MFYFWASLSGFCIGFDLYCLTTLFTPGLNSLFALIFGLFFTCICLNETKKKFFKAHKNRDFGKYCGWAIILFGTYGLFNELIQFNSDFFTGLAVVIMCYFIGTAFILYNKSKKEVKEPIPEAEPVQPLNDSADLEKKALREVLRNLNRTWLLPEAQQNPAFEARLKNCSLYLDEISKNNYHIDRHLLSQVNDLLIAYQNISDDRIRTEASEKTLREIENTITKFEKALQKMYDQSNDSLFNEVESNLKTFDMKLTLEGLTDSDFPFENNNNGK